MIILRLIEVLPVRIDDHPSKDLKLCIIALFFVCQFAVSLNAFSSISFHVVGPRYCLVRNVFAILVMFLLFQQKYVTQTSCSIIVSFGLHSR